MYNINDIPPHQCEIPTTSLLTSGNFPVDELVEFAIREGRRPRPIYTAHKWFARRLGTVFRSLLVGSSISADSDFWRAYYGEANLQGCRVLDPFVGGGTSLYEAHRLGATVFGVDVDPVACAVTNLELDAKNIKSLAKTLQSLKKIVGERIAQYHVHQEDGLSHQILHHFWVQQVTCAECGHIYDVHPNYRLAKDESEQWVFCSECGEIEKRHPNHKSFKCKSCGHRTIIDSGCLDRGQTTCPNCKTIDELIQIGRRAQTPPEWRIFAVETIPTPLDRRAIPIKNRTFRPANQHSINLYTRASQEYKERKTSQPFAFPEMRISATNRADNRLIDYGYRAWTDLFNHRQLLHLSLLAEAILELPEELKSPLSMAFSNHLTTNCMLTSYAVGWRRLTPLFSLRSFRHIHRPVELNPWIDRTGRGTFPNAVHQLSRAVDYAKSPKEPKKNGQFTLVPPIEPKERGSIKCGTARNIDFLENNSIDMVLTDPPYFDNIAYSELAEFFHPWLHTLGVFEAQHNIDDIKLESIVGQRSKVGSLTRYTDNLCAAFHEATRTLKPSGLMIFSFRHILPEAWHALAKALAPHPLMPVRVLPVPGETGTGLHNHSGTGLWDAVIILRKEKRSDTHGNLVITSCAYNEALKTVAEWSQRLNQTSLPFAKVDEIALLRATLISSALQDSNSAFATGDHIQLDKALRLPV